MKAASWTPGSKPILTAPYCVEVNEVVIASAARPRRVACQGSGLGGDVPKPMSIV